MKQYCKICGRPIVSGLYCSDHQSTPNKLDENIKGSNTNSQPVAKKSFYQSLNEQSPKIDSNLKNDDKNVKQSYFQYIPVIIFIVVVTIVKNVYGVDIWRAASIIWLIYAVIYIIGIFATSWYFKNKKANNTLMEIIAWLSLIAWIIPPIGILFSSITMEFSQLIAKRSVRYKILSIIGFSLVAINVVMAIINNINNY